MKVDKVMIRQLVDRVWKSFVEGAVLYVGAHAGEIDVANLETWLQMLAYGAAMAGLSAIINGVVQPALKGWNSLDKDAVEGMEVPDDDQGEG